jgi:hypothetical protein
MSQRDKEARRRKGKVSKVQYTGYVPVNTEQYINPRPTASSPVGQTSITEKYGNAPQKQPGFVDQLDQGYKTYQGLKKVPAAYEKFSKGVDKAGDWLGENVPDSVQNTFFSGPPDATMNFSMGPPPPSTDVPYPTGSPGAEVAPWNPDPSMADINEATTGYTGLNTPPPAPTPESLGLPSAGGQAAARGANVPIGESSLLSNIGQRASNFGAGLIGGSQTALDGTFSAASGGTQLAGTSATAAGTAAVDATGMVSQKAAEKGAELAAQSAAQAGAAKAAQSGLSKTLENAAPFVSGAIQAYQAHEAFKRGDYINGSIDTIQVGIGFIPGGSLVNIPIDILQYAFS